MNKKGFTLLEIVITIALFGLIVGAAVQIFLSSLRSTAIVFDQLTAQSQGRKTVQEFVTEVRSANYSSIGAFPIDTASTTMFSFYTNDDSDSFVEMVRYYLSGRNLIKGVTKPTGSPLSYSLDNEVTSTVATSINNNSSTPIFYYYDQNYTSSTSSPLTYPIDITKVRIVVINLIIDKDPIYSPTSLNLRAQAEMRNMK